MSHVTLSRAPESQSYQVEDRRGGPMVCYHRAAAVLSHLLYMGTYLRRHCCPEKGVNEPTLSSVTGRYDLKTLPWKSDQNSDGLCLFLHGLNASAKQWETYTRQFPKDFPATHYLAGSVFRAGNCSLEAAGDPFVELVEDYLRKFPDKPIILIGTSNGARIASYIETKLNPELLKKSRLQVFSIAGVHNGTVLMDLANRVCCARALRHHPDIAKDLSFNSSPSRSLLSALQERQGLWTAQGVEVTHHFFATTEDEKVRPLSSSLPYLPSTPSHHYQVIYSESHETIVDRVLPQIWTLLRRS